ncbi:MAG: hypothetical protein PHP57_02130 [Sideroxydans sp.]|nr:hypothetical protein [Sideroxydans sp.]
MSRRSRIEPSGAERDGAPSASLDTAAPTDETTSQSTKPASWQVAGYRDERFGE